MIKLSTYLKQYRVGDIVDVVANGAVQKGMVCRNPSAKRYPQGQYLVRNFLSKVAN